MGENGDTNFRNWGLLSSQMVPFNGHLDLQLMSSMENNAHYRGGSVIELNLPQQQITHQLHPSNIATSMIGGPYHHHYINGIPDSLIPISYFRDSCLSLHQEKILNVLPIHQHPQEFDYTMMPESSLSHPAQFIQQGNLMKNDIAATTQKTQVSEETDSVGLGNKRGADGKDLKSSKSKKQKMAPKGESSRAANRARTPKKTAEVIINGISMDISGIPVPVCTCTGIPQQCYRWGAGGWQSSCCTTSLSVHPLPLSSKRRGARIPGRKMSFGAFRKVLEKLASEGYDFSNPIDLLTHWAKHGTNKFVTIR